jgi:hypothetical protein
MSDLIGGIVQKQVGGNAAGMEKQAQQSQNNGGRAFENVLQQNGGQGATGAENQSVGKINDPKLESMRVDLVNRYQNLPEGAPKVSAIFPEYLDTKTRMSAFNNILNQAIGSNGNTPQATDIKGRFSQVEGEWAKLDGIMRSDKELSQGELLGLQARLYQVSQHIDVLSKVVDQMSSGVKTILNTNV